MRKSFLFRPGDRLSEQQISVFPPDPTPWEFEGYRHIGVNWKGASAELTPENRINWINLHDSPGGFGGLTLGMASSDAKIRFPSLAVVETAYDDGPADKRMVFYCAPLPDQGFELLVTTRGGSVVRIALAWLGYWHDPERQARYARGETAAAEIPSVKERELEERRLKAQAEASVRERWKSLDDPDAMLDAWCEAAPAQKRALADELRSSPPTEWSGIAERFNFHDGLAPLFWIVRQSNAELETLFDMFVLCEPDYFCDPAHQTHIASMGELALIEAIKARIDRGFYRSPVDFDGISAWDNAALGKRDAAYMSPYRDTLRQYFVTKR